MALKTNSKEVREKIRAFVMDNYTPDNYGEDTPETFEETAGIILKWFRKEKSGDYYFNKYPESVVFEDWLGGLPSIFDCDYYYRTSAIDVLGDILEQTETERNRFEEMDAEKLLTSLIYRELIKGEEKAHKTIVTTVNIKNLELMPEHENRVAEVTA